MKAMTSWLVSAICAALLISAVAASDITIKDVTVALLEGSGTEVSSRVLSGPNSEKLGVLDHTRTLKVQQSPARRFPHFHCARILLFSEPVVMHSNAPCDAGQAHCGSGLCP